MSSDRLWTLPASVLRRILSYLPFPTVIRTSVLSRRWRTLCYNVWSLSDPSVFRITRRPHPKEFAKARRQWLSSSKPFRDIFVDGKGVMSAMYYRMCSQPWETLPIVGRKTFRFSLRRSYIVDAPRRILSLVVVNLERVFLTDETLRGFVSCCPFLRFLYLRMCHSLERIELDAPKMKTLRIVNCARISEVDLSGVLALESYQFTGISADSWDLCDYEQRLMSEFYFGFYLGSFGNIHNVTVLTLSNAPFRVLANEVYSGSLPNRFENLKELQLLMKTMTNGNLKDIYRFFLRRECCRLETLFVELPYSGIYPEMEEGTMPVQPLPFQVNFARLTSIKVKYFKGNRNESQLARFLLESAGRLDRMFIVDHSLPTNSIRSPISGAYSERVHKVFAMAKASANAEIIFSKYDDRNFEPCHRPGFFY